MEFNRVALVIGHPGHELRVFGLLKKIKPYVLVLTDGSGFNKDPRIDSTRAILHENDCKYGSIFGRFSDRQFYDVMLQKDMAFFVNLAEEIAATFVSEKVELVVGDAIEGFNPTHDVCRYLINASVDIVERKYGQVIRNYDFLVQGSPDSNGTYHYIVNDDVLDKKINTALTFPGIGRDVDEILDKYGRNAFKTETLRLIENRHALTGWRDERPHYEHVGLERTRSSQYESTITFTKHLEPIGRALLSYAQGVTPVK